MFIQRCRPNFGKPVVIGWEVSDHPVEDNADTLVVRGFNQGAQFFRRTETAGRRATNRLPDSPMSRQTDIRKQAEIQYG